MLPFPRFFLLAGVGIGAVFVVFVVFAVFLSRPDPELPLAQLTPVEREQLRNQIRHRQLEWGAPPVHEDDVLTPSALPVRGGHYQFRSGLSLEERQALREQVRGMNPEMGLDDNPLSESVAVNESYPDGVSAPIIDSDGAAGQNR